MKKILCLLFVSILILSLSACVNTDTANKTSETNMTVDTSTPTDTSKPVDTSKPADTNKKYMLRFVANGQEILRTEMKQGDNIVIPKPTQATMSYIWDVSVPARMPAKDLTITAVAIEGNISSSVKWSYNFIDTLKVYGNGNIPNYSDENTQPWKEYKDHIKYLNLESGITQIGQFSFFGLSKITKVTIPDTVSIIGSYSFANCDEIQTIVIGSGVKNIGKQAFASSANISSVEFKGATVWYTKEDNYNNSFTAVTSTWTNAVNFNKYKDGEFSTVEGYFPSI